MLFDILPISQLVRNEITNYLFTRSRAVGCIRIPLPHLLSSSSVDLPQRRSGQSGPVLMPGLDPSCYFPLVKQSTNRNV